MKGTRAKAAFLCSDIQKARKASFSSSLARSATAFLLRFRLLLSGVQLLGLVPLPPDSPALAHHQVPRNSRAADRRLLRPSASRRPPPDGAVEGLGDEVGQQPGRHHRGPGSSGCSAHDSRPAAISNSEVHFEHGPGPPGPGEPVPGPTMGTRARSAPKAASMQCSYREWRARVGPAPCPGGSCRTGDGGGPGPTPNRKTSHSSRWGALLLDSNLLQRMAWPGPPAWPRRSRCWADHWGDPGRTAEQG